MYKNGNCIDNHYLLEGFNENKSKDRHCRRNIIACFYQWKCGKLLPKAGGQIINVYGVALSNFLNIVKNGYFIRTAVITDSVAGTSAEKRADNLKKEYDSNIINVCITQNQGTFEK